ncbi:MAG: PQQ-binding-like beta-propeller repeat protein [Anaerolineales bacterium]
MALFDGWENDIVLVSTVESELYALDLHNARLLWRNSADTLDGTIQEITIGYDGRAYGINNNGWLYVLDPYSGEIIARIDIGEFEGIKLVPTVTEIAIYLAGENNLRAYDLSTYDLAWIAETRGLVTTPIVAAEPWSVLLAGTENGYLQAFSMLTGEIVWEEFIGRSITGLAYDWENIYITAEEGLIVVWDGWSEEVTWTLDLETIINSGPVALGGYFYIGTENNQVRIFDVNSREEIEGIYYDDLLSYTPIPLGGWFFLRNDYAVAAFGPGELPSDE